MNKQTSIRVLVLEPERSQQKWYERNKEECRFACAVVSTIEEALKTLLAESFAAFLCGSEGGEGRELIAAVRARFPRMPVIVVSRENSVRHAVEAMKLGAADYLLKPPATETLEAAIVEAVDRAAQAAVEPVKPHPAMAHSPLMPESAAFELDNMRDLTMEVLGNSLNLKDSETEGHSKRVTAFTMALARAMGVNDAAIQSITRGAYLHDIGKMAVPDAILKKSGPLTSSEMTTMQSHCELGYAIIRKVPYLTEAAEIVRAHQERFDGSGYPRGLKGAEIPLGARIFAVADTLDAITSDRPYRRAHSIEFARREIERCAGTQFDPAVVDVFLNLPSSLWIQIRDEILEQEQKLR